MKLARYKACICEGSAESAIIDILLDHGLLIFKREDLKMPDVKSYEFVKSYFADPVVLVKAIKKYYETAKVRKGEYTLLDLLT